MLLPSVGATLSSMIYDFIFIVFVSVHPLLLVSTYRLLAPEGSRRL